MSCRAFMWQAFPGMRFWTTTTTSRSLLNRVELELVFQALDWSIYPIVMKAEVTSA
jgi:hypothetical protein